MLQAAPRMYFERKFLVIYTIYLLLSQVGGAQRVGVTLGVEEFKVIGRLQVGRDRERNQERDESEK